MQQSSGTQAGKVQCIDVLLHRERSPSDPRLDTCTGSPKGAGPVCTHRNPLAYIHL